MTVQTSLIISPAHPAPVEARLTDPGEPGYPWSTARDWFVVEQLFRHPDAPEYVTPRSALTYSFVYRCVSYIAQSIASLGWHVFERQSDGRTRLPIEDNIAWTLGMQANPEMTAFAWREVTLKDCLLWGNSYSEIERNNAGKILWKWRLDPWRVQLDRTVSGRLFYDVANGSGPNTALSPAEVFHTRNLGEDGLVGLSTIELSRRTIELGMAEERFGQSFFRRGPMPGGVLEIPGNMKKEERDAMRLSFEQTYGGGRNAGRVVVLTGGTKFTSMTLPNSDAQWIEAQNFSGEQVARIYGVPAHKVGLLEHATFANIEHQAIEAVQDCLLPWCRRLETEADVKLFGMVTMGRRYTRLNLETLLRGDSKTQTENITSQVNNGLRTVNEGRELLDLNPIDGGDTPLVQGAMVPLERVLEPPAPEPAPPPGQKPPQPSQDGQTSEGDPMPEDVRTTFLALLEDAYGRLLRVEADKARRADKQDNLLGWAEGYYSNGAADHVASVLRPIVSGLLLAAGRPAGGAASLADQLARDHNERSLTLLRDGGAAEVEAWVAGQYDVTRPQWQALAHLETAWKSLGRKS